MIATTGGVRVYEASAAVRRWPAAVFARIGSTTYTGVDDTKLFVWPGRGLFSITGRHDETPGAADQECSQYNWMQYLAQVNTPLPH
jgi:hypothetical protein